MKQTRIILLLVFALFVAMLVGLLFGSSGIGPIDAIKAIASILGFGDSPETHTRIILLMRLPRMLVSVLSGMALGLAGALSQTLFRNDLADPYIAGIGSGAIFGVNIALLSGASLTILGFSTVSVFAFAGAVLACLIIWLLSGRTGSTGTSLVLAGVALSFVFAGLNYIIVVLGRDILQKTFFWSYNGLSSSSYTGVIFLAIAVTISIAMLAGLPRKMDAYLLGDEQATYLGVNPVKLRSLMFVIVSLLTGMAVTTAGLMGFVGLITPHISRRIVGGESRYVVPCSILLGGVTLGLADAVGRSIMPFQEIPASVIMNIAGGLFFFYLVSRKPSW